MTIAPVEEKVSARAGHTAVDIVGCGVLSAAGSGLDELAELRPVKPTPQAEDWPPLDVAPVAGFDPEAMLGRKGLARLSPADRLAMAACLAALDAAGEGPPAAGTGIALGTSVGSGSTLLEFFRDTFEQDRPYLVNPSQFPGTLMNSAAGKTAIRRTLTGVNATVSGGPLAGMHALRYACGALRRGHAQRMLAGAVEELSRESAWAWHRGAGLARDIPLGEGAAVFALDAVASAEKPVLGRLLACETGFADVEKGTAAVAGRLAAVVRSALDRAGASPDEVLLAVPGASGRRGWAAVEERALRAAVPAAARLPVGAALGETHAAGVALHLAALLARWTWHRTAERLAVVTSLGFDGSVGCLVVGRPDTERTNP